MALGFDLGKREILDNDHANDIYRYNLAQNHALLSGDSAIVRRFYQQNAKQLGCSDIYKWHEIGRSFFFNARPKNAFVYAGLIPWIVESVVRLIASSGFQVSSVLSNSEDSKFAEAYKQDMDDYIKTVVENDINLQALFERGVYLESGLGDFAYRISYDPELSDKPIVDFIEPHLLEIEWKRGKIKTITIKESSDEIPVGNSSLKQRVEIKEIYSKKNGIVCIDYKFFLKDKEITIKNPTLFENCKKYWGITKLHIELHFNDFPIVYKQNYKKSELYKCERGVPDIQGLGSIEDALSESLSTLVDTIRKAAPKTFVDEELLPADIKGETEQYSAFDHEYLLIKNSGLDPTKLLVTIQARIDYQSHVETAKMLISHAINKAGLSPTTLGVTGLESINSAAESQDAREKPSLRTREEKLKGWKLVLSELINKYFMYLAYVNGEEIQDYSKLFDITFNDYISPATENVVTLISQAVAGQVYSVESGVEKTFLHEGRDYTLDDIIIEAARIRGITPTEEMQLLGIIEQEDTQEEEMVEENKEQNAEGEEPSVFDKENKSTGTLNEE